MVTSQPGATPQGAARQAGSSSPGSKTVSNVPGDGPCHLSLPAPCSLPARCGLPCELFVGPERHAVLELGHMARLGVIIEPGLRGSFRRQAEELLAQLLCIVRRHGMTLTATTMTVFLRNGADEVECRIALRSWFGDAMPVTTFAVQPPLSGAALAIELWALGGPGVKVERLGPDLIAVESDGIRWVYCSGICGDAGSTDPYHESTTAFERMKRRLAAAGVSFDQVVRTWIFVNQITDGAEDRQRYQEMNRARTDFYRDLQFGAKTRAPWAPETIYPASTGIGTNDTRMAMACMALDSRRPDVFILPLENPRQTPAYEYQARYSPQSPKFSRAMAVVQGHFVATLVSGTASIVDSKTCHPGDIARQTKQAIENIERLIAPENFARHGLPGSGATLEDVAKLRVYVKRPGDYERCRSVVESRWPRTPAIYLNADICRPDLLVEIEAVAFSPLKVLEGG